MTHREWAWLGLAVSVFMAARLADPDAVGSPAAPYLALLMTIVALSVGAWLVVDHRHRHHHPHHR